MSRPKKLCAMLGILAAVCGATLILLQIEERQEKIKNSGEVILRISEEAVTSLSWEYEGTTLAFHKEETWLYDGDEAFPVSENKIKELLSPFQALSAAFVIEDVEDYGQYGLDDPICTIGLSTEEQSYQILLGDYSRMDSLRYICIGDGNAYLAQSDPLDYFDTGLRQMIENDAVPDLGHAAEIRFTGSEHYSVVYEEDSMEDAAQNGDQDTESEIPAGYVRIGESPIIYEISADRYQELMATAYDDLRHSEVLWADFADVRQIDISLAGAAYTFTSEENGGGRAWFYREKALEVTGIQTALEALSAGEFTDQQPTQKREIVLTIHLDNENFQEVQIDLYRYDGRLCLAAVDGESTSLVARSDVVNLMEAVRAVILK